MAVTTSDQWVRAASSTRTSSGVAPFCGANTAAAPAGPSSGLSTSAASTRVVVARRGSSPDRSSRCRSASAAPPSGSSSPSASSNRAPRAASRPAPPSVLADPPTPTTTSSAPRSSAADSASPNPRLDAVSGAGMPPGSRPSPHASAISTTTVTRVDPAARPGERCGGDSALLRWGAAGSRPATTHSSGRTASVALTGSPVGPCTATGTAANPAASAAATVPSPPSATGTTTTRAVGATSSRPRRTASATSSEVSEPLNASLATTTVGTAPQP